MMEARCEGCSRLMGRFESGMTNLPILPLTIRHKGSLIVKALSGSVYCTRCGREHNVITLLSRARSDTHREVNKAVA